MTRIQAPKKMRVAGAKGMHIMVLQAGEVRSVNDDLAIAAQRKGCIVLQAGQAPIDFSVQGAPESKPDQETQDPDEDDPADSIQLDDPVDDIPGLADALAPEPVVEPVDAERIEQVVDAIKLIYQTGNDKALTVGGDPKVKPLEEILGFDITSEERDAGLKAYREQEEG
jgi:hypothetical protein